MPASQLVLGVGTRVGSHTSLDLAAEVVLKTRSPCRSGGFDEADHRPQCGRAFSGRSEKGRGVSASSCPSAPSAASVLPERVRVPLMCLRTSRSSSLVPGLLFLVAPQAAGTWGFLRPGLLAFSWRVSLAPTFRSFPQNVVQSRGPGPAGDSGAPQASLTAGGWVLIRAHELC